MLDPNAGVVCPTSQNLSCKCHPSNKLPKNFFKKKGQRMIYLTRKIYQGQKSLVYPGK